MNHNVRRRNKLKDAHFSFGDYSLKSLSSCDSSEDITELFNNERIDSISEALEDQNDFIVSNECLKEHLEKFQKKWVDDKVK